MKFELDLEFECATERLSLSAALERPERLCADTPEIHEWMGCIKIQRSPDTGDYADPIIRLVTLWLRKLPWVLAGDTETVALANSEQCFAFVPAGESVEWSFFTGSETEIEEYIVEPTTARLDQFVQESLRIGDELLQLLRKMDAHLLESHEDCKDLQISFTEAQRAWREQKLRQRR
jgi:hypothetical protein